jgi:predicted DNA-binding transcriptional regulator AlpA
MKSNIYPRPIKLGSKAVAWRVSDIRATIERLSVEQGVTQ